MRTVVSPSQVSWQDPPEPIAAMLDQPRSPVVSFSPDRQWILELSLAPLVPLVALTEPKVAIAGIEINPITRTSAHEGYYQGMTLRRFPAQDQSQGQSQDQSQDQGESELRRAIALPSEARISHVSWSRDSRYIALTLTEAEGVSLWVIPLETALETGEARRLTGPILNGIYGSPYRWLPGEAGFIAKVRPENQGFPPEAPQIPPGPILEENLGRVAPARTYTNLLASCHDEALFEYYFQSALEQIDLEGHRRQLREPELLLSAQPSPDGAWLLVRTLQPPFSYQVPLQRFPTQYWVCDRQGQSKTIIAELPLADEISTDFEAVRPGRRWVSWRADHPATLFWPEALDEGDAKRQVPYRDAIYQQAAPFTADPQLLWKTELRFRGIAWGTEQLALGYEGWYDSRLVRQWWLQPGADWSDPVLLESRNFQDAYGHPGNPLTAPGPYGWSTLIVPSDGLGFYLEGRGASAAGIFPFLDRVLLSQSQSQSEPQKKQRLWQAEGQQFERLQLLLDRDARQFITQRQSQTSPPNYVLRDRFPAQFPDPAQSPTLAQSLYPLSDPQPLTQFHDPLPWYRQVHKDQIRYQRSDGLDLSGMLYLPPQYQPERDGPLPILLWVYPEEYKSRETASQVTDSEWTFSRPSGSSVLFLLTQGYGVLLGPSMPILGEAETEPNDSYLEQLVDNAEAAVAALVARGVGDRDRLAIGGHSYGAFTAANLLAHSRLFQAGIARSGAYNRTLTPFGFQGEQRHFWEATETYIKISPFTYAAQIKAPLLLIHGAADNNPGTYPLQSERLYEALRGLGGTVRWVSLPHEGHGYRSREAIGHVLWEMVRWLDQYL